MQGASASVWGLMAEISAELPSCVAGIDVVVEFCRQ